MTFCVVWNAPIIMTTIIEFQSLNWLDFIQRDGGPGQHKYISALVTISIEIINDAFHRAWFMSPWISPKIHESMESKNVTLTIMLSQVNMKPSFFWLIFKIGDDTSFFKSCNIISYLLWKNKVQSSSSQYLITRKYIFISTMSYHFYTIKKQIHKSFYQDNGIIQCFVWMGI